jgi:hypothetical protein
MANPKAIGRMYLSRSKVLLIEAYHKTPASTHLITAWRAITL